MSEPDAQSMSAISATAAIATRTAAHEAERHPEADRDHRREREEVAPSGSWIERLREMIGLKPSATLRENLETELSRDDALDAAFTPEERAMLRNILHLRETRVEDVMVPRADIDAVDVDVTLAGLLLHFERSGHSRTPVYRETLDEPIGMVHIKDLMAYITDHAKLPLADAIPKGTAGVADASAETVVAALDIGAVDLSQPLESTGLVRQLLFVPPSMPATELLTRMQTTHIQIALVIDEYGGVDGLVSIEDIVETIVGEIDDEHDEFEGPTIVEAEPGVFLADARATVEDVVAAIGRDFDVSDYGDDIETLGGLLVNVLGHIPAAGQVIALPHHSGYEFEVLDADPRRIKRLRIVYRPPADETTEVPAGTRTQRIGGG